MRRFIVVVLLLSLAGCTAMLVGGAQSDQAPRDCEEYPDQKHCE